MMRCTGCEAEAGDDAVAVPSTSWHYRHCRACAHAVLAPVPSATELARYYNGLYQVPKERYAAAAQRSFRYLHELLKSTAPGNRVLELGCSYGFTLANLRALAWQVSGVELDARAAAFARETLNIPVEVASADQTPLPRDAYDAIMLLHVIEHLTDVSGVLHRCHDALRPGGVILIKTPNVTSLSSRLCGGRWEWSAPPEHLRLFSPRSLCSTLERHGFEVLICTTRRGDANDTLWEILRASLRAMLDRTKPRQPQTIRSLAEGDRTEVPLTQRAWYLTLQGVSRLVTTPIEVILGRMRLGAELLVVAHRHPHNHP